MKKIFSLIVIILLMLQSCKESKIEIIPDNDSEYLTFDKVDESASLKNRQQNEQELRSMLKEEIKGDSNSADNNLFDYRLYIGANGKIEKIRILNSQNKKIDSRVFRTLENWSFTPAKLDGKPVKCRFDLKVSQELLNEGKLIPDFTKDKDFLLEVDQMPMPVGGIRAIAKNIIYPAEAKKKGIEGKVFLRVFISEKGDVVATKVIKGIGYGCDEAAYNAVKKCKFTPALKNEKPVKVQIVFPIVFHLQ